MILRILPFLTALATMAGLAGCVEQTGETVARAGDFTPNYQGVDTRLLDGDLVNFHVTMQGHARPMMCMPMQNVPQGNMR